MLNGFFFAVLRLNRFRLHDAKRNIQPHSNGPPLHHHLSISTQDSDSTQKGFVNTLYSTSLFSPTYRYRQCLFYTLAAAPSASPPPSHPARPHRHILRSTGQFRHRYHYARLQARTEIIMIPHPDGFGACRQARNTRKRVGKTYGFGVSVEA